VARNLKGHPVLLECVLGALGLAVEQSVVHAATDHPPELPQDKARRWKNDLQRRLAFLTQLRRRIEANKQRLARGPSAEDRKSLEISLKLREALYDKHVARVRRIRARLARLERQIRPAG
jgi:hypothetical protein